MDPISSQVCGSDRAGTGVTVSRVCCFEVPSMRTGTPSSAHSLRYVAGTCSIRATNSPLFPAGMRQYRVPHGLRRFFWRLPHRPLTDRVEGPGSTSRLASSFMVHLASPSGGSPQPVATGLASAAPSRLRFAYSLRSSASSRSAGRRRFRRRPAVVGLLSVTRAISPSVYRLSPTHPGRRGPGRSPASSAPSGTCGGQLPSAPASSRITL